MPQRNTPATLAGPVPPLLKRLPFKSLDRRILSVFIATAASAGCWEIYFSYRQIRAGLGKNVTAQQVDDATSRLCAAGVLELLAESEGVGGSPWHWRIRPDRIKRLREVTR